MRTNEARTRGATRAKPIYALFAGAILGLVVMPIAFAGAAKGPEATASASVKKKIKKLNKKVKGLNEQVAELQGEQGQPRAPSGPAGGDLTGTYPNPLIGPNAVGSAEIEDNAVGTAKLADDSVTSAKIPNGAIQSSELDASSVGAAQLKGVQAIQTPVPGTAVADGTSQEVKLSCPAGTRILSGGAEWGSDLPGTSLIYSAPDIVGNPLTTWAVRGRVAAGATDNAIFAHALCINA